MESLLKSASPSFQTQSRGKKLEKTEATREEFRCGSMTRDKKKCMERPRILGAKWTGKSIVPYEKIETFKLDYEVKGDRWNGYDAASYKHVIERYEAMDEARRKYLKEQRFKKLEKKNSNQNIEGGVIDVEDNKDDLKVDDATKVD